MKPETIALLISMASFCIGVVHQVWKISQAVSSMRHGLEKQDLRLEHMNERQILAFNGFKEKIEHFITRSRGEKEVLDRRLESVENFLVKTTAFEKR